ncbi:MAG: hypothetical protein KAS39_01235, partial [Actinomycetia bacterium]|nr:hypothetical protein [Actinomycetes bacterium]
ENINYVLKDEDKFYFGGKTLYEFDIKNKITTKIISIVSNDFLTYIYKEGNDLYIGKNKGISLVDLYIDPNKSETLYKKDEILEKFAVKNSYINHIEKSENILWISTKNNGIIKYIQNNP